MTTAERRALGRRLNRLDPWRGACAFCGSPDARHRLWDSLRVVPEPAAYTARWFSVPLALVRLVRRYPDRTLSAASKTVRTL